VGLLRMVDPARGGKLLDRVTTLRNHFAADLGVVMPRVRIRDNLALDEHGYAIKMFDNEIAHGECYPLRNLAIASEKTVGELDGIATTDPASGNPAYWIDSTQTAPAAAADYTTLAPVDVVLAHLAKVIRDRVEELLTREATRRLIDRVREQSPTIVDELIPGKLSLSDVQRVLQLLIRENVSIRNLATILEALGDRAKTTNDVELLAEYVRQRLGREIVSRYTTVDSVLEVLRPGDLVVDALRTGNESAWREYPEFVRSLSMRFDWAHQQAARPVLLVPSDVRSTIRQQALKSARGIVVLGEAEVPRDTQLRQLGDVIESHLIDN